MLEIESCHKPRYSLSRATYFRDCHAVDHGNKLSTESFSLDSFVNTTASYTQNALSSLA